MFKIESYITPIILNHVAKYVKNIRPQDAQLSLWQGEVAFQNLDLRLDVLEEELQLPFQFLSGHIHELIIHVPWTKLTSEPINFTINTIEFVLKLKDGSSNGSNESTPQTEKRKKISKVEDAGYMPGLVNKLANNIAVDCHNIILKYVEEDIVVSMNVQLLSFSSADENWKRSFIDINPTKVLLRKLIQISDLTICLDKRNSAGQIDVCQEPILYRCTLEMRMLRKYNVATATTHSTTRIDVFTNSMDINVSSQQFPMAMRLLLLLITLKDGKFRSKSDSDSQGDLLQEQEQFAKQNESYISWAWNLLPTIFPEETIADDLDAIDGHYLSTGFYCDKLKLTLKSLEMFSDSIVQSTRKVRYHPILRLSMAGIFGETFIAGNKWFNFRSGVSEITLEPLGSFDWHTQGSDATLNYFLNSKIKPECAYIEGSLFDIELLDNSRNLGSFNVHWDEHFNEITENYLRYRGPALSLDMVHFIDIPSDAESSDVGSDLEFSNLSEKLLTRIFISSLNARINSSLLSVIETVEMLIKSYDYPPYVREKVEPEIVKLSPPSTDDYDSLMADIPRRIYEIHLLNCTAELHPRDEENFYVRNVVENANATRKSQHKAKLPYFIFEVKQIELVRTDPIYSKRLVHTTCQLPDKPKELLDACFSKFRGTFKNIFLYTATGPRTTLTLCSLPQAVMSYESILHENLWLEENTTKEKFEAQLSSILFVFNRPQQLLTLSLLPACFKHNPSLLLEMTKSSTKNDLFDPKLPKIEIEFAELSLQTLCFNQTKTYKADLKSIYCHIYVPKTDSRFLILNAPSDWLDARPDAKIGEAILQLPKDYENIYHPPILTMKMGTLAVVLDPILLEFLDYAEQELKYLLEESNRKESSVGFGSETRSSKVSHISERQSKKFIQPEETIHLSSEKADKLEMSSPDDKNQSDAIFDIIKLLPIIKCLVLNFETGQCSITIPSSADDNYSKINGNGTTFCFPIICCKSSYALELNQLNVFPFTVPGNGWSKEKDTFPWNCEFSELVITTKFCNIERLFISPGKTSITIALNHRKDNASNRDNLALNLHIDTSPVVAYVSEEQILRLKEALEMTYKIRYLFWPESKSDTNEVVEKPRLLTTPEDDNHIKEFLAINTNSEKTNNEYGPLVKKESYSSSLTISTWLQWTVTKTTIFLNGSDKFHRHKFSLEFEDFITSVDSQDVYFKLKTKIGAMNGRYHTLNENSEWILNEKLKIRVRPETVETKNETFFDLTVTTAETGSVFEKWGATKKIRNLNRSLTEVMIFAQGMDIHFDLDALKHFLPIYCAAVQSKKSASESRVTCVNDLPLFYFDCKTVVVYIPIKIRKNWREALILKIGKIKVSPNVENPLTRNPIRPDIFTKAAQLRILNTPGSRVEDRQYEIVFEDISAVTANWFEVLAYMQDNAESFQNTNPAFEWNNQSKKSSIHLNQIFSNFIISVIYAPCIVYKMIIVCGESIEVNFLNDLITDLTSEQILLLDQLYVSIQRLLKILNSHTASLRCSSAASFQHSTSSTSIVSQSAKHAFSDVRITPETKYSKILKINKTRRGDRVSAVAQTIKSPSENVTADSGIVSVEKESKPVQAPESLVSIHQPSFLSAEDDRKIPCDISFVAGILLVRLYILRKERRKTGMDSPIARLPVIATTFTQPSMMISQKYYERTLKLSLFNLNVSFGWRSDDEPQDSSEFSDIVFETRQGNLDHAGIPPPLFAIQFKETIIGKTEVDCNFSRPMKLFISHKTLDKFVKLRQILNDVFIVQYVRSKQTLLPVVRRSKIEIIKNLLFNADILNLSVDQLNIEFRKQGSYDVKSSIGKLVANFIFSNHPEKLKFGATIESFLISTDRRILCHPVTFGLSGELTQEFWHRFPAIQCHARCDVLQIDFGPENMKNVQKFLEYFSASCKDILARLEQLEKDAIAVINNLQEQTVDNRNLIPIVMPTPSVRSFQQPNEELYQDDLRAGAFQFIETKEGEAFPLPYQINIILKDNGIVCWRYPQPRCIGRLQVFPVPIETTFPVRIRCRLEFYSEVHSEFLPYCDFHLCESDTQLVQLPNQTVTAHMWRVVILQSLISVDGRCFEESTSSEDDEEFMALQIQRLKIEDLLETAGGEREFRLPPKALVACMRIDSSFSPNAIPQVQLLFDVALIKINLQNQYRPSNSKLPNILKHFKLAEDIVHTQTFMSLEISNIKVNANILKCKNFNLNSNLSFCLQAIDYGYLNMLHVVEETTLSTFIDYSELNIVLNLILDSVKLNIGPAILQALLLSYCSWENALKDEQLEDIIILTRFVICNATNRTIYFGQAKTNEIVNLKSKEFCFYCFRSDNCEQRLVFNVESGAISGESVAITKEGISYLRMKEKDLLLVQVEKVSSTQFVVYLRGQIEVLSMTNHNLKIQCKPSNFDMKRNYEQVKRTEFVLHAHGRLSYFGDCLKDSDWCIRIKLSGDDQKGWSGDIPLKATPKNIPWLVKVPIQSNQEFLSFWVRIVREELTEATTKDFRPQRVLVIIWPMFLIRSTLPTPMNVVEVSSGHEYITKGQGAIEELSIAGTHETSHELLLKKTFISTHGENLNGPVLSYKKIEWGKFFHIDEKFKTIEATLKELAKPIETEWPYNDGEYKNCLADPMEGAITPILKFLPSRELSCSLMLSISPSHLFLNLLGIQILISGENPDENLAIDPNKIAVPVVIKDYFKLSIEHKGKWIASKTIVVNESSYRQSKKDVYILPEIGSIKIEIQHLSFVSKLRLHSSNENGTRIIRLGSQYIVANFTKHPLSLFAFSLAEKEKLYRGAVSGKIEKSNLSFTVPKIGRAEGLSIDKFHTVTETNIKSSFLFFVRIFYDDVSEGCCPISLLKPFNRRCSSIYTKNGQSIPLGFCFIEQNGDFYLNIYDDPCPVFEIDNQTDLTLYVAQTYSTESNKTTQVVSNYDVKLIDWHHTIHARSQLFYTPANLLTSFPDEQSLVCNIAFAMVYLREEENIVKSENIQLRWSKPVLVDAQKEQFLYIPFYGDVKLIVCDKHKTTRITICNVTQQLEFSVQDLRTRLQYTKNADVKSATYQRMGSATNIIDSVKATSSIMCSSEDELTKCLAHDEKPLLPLNCKIFIKDFIFSFIVDCKEQCCLKTPIFAMYIDDLFLKYKHKFSSAEILLSNLQIDNQLHSTGIYDFPVVLCPKTIYKRTSWLPLAQSMTERTLELTPNAAGFIQFSFYEGGISLESVICKLAPMHAYIEDTYLHDLIDSIVECDPDKLIYLPIKIPQSEVCQPGYSIMSAEVINQFLDLSEPIKLKFIRVEQLSVMLSVHTCVRMYIALDHSPLDFSHFERRNIITLPARFGYLLAMHYFSGAIFGAGWVLGSLEILGSPSGLARSLTTGLRDFVSMPVQGLLRGPWEFIMGITHGSASLVRNITAGTVNSVTKLAASVARNLDRLTLDDEHYQRTEVLRRSRPQGFTEGLSQGLTGLGISLLGAVGGLARHPLEARSPVEVVTGVGRGIVGAFTKPISGAAELVALTGQGILHTAGFNAMPGQRMIGRKKNPSIYPAECKLLWKFLPGVLSTDQVLFYYEATLVSTDSLKRVLICMTASIFAVLDLEKDVLSDIIAVGRVAASFDRNDETLINIRALSADDAIDETEIQFTRARILSFLHGSNDQISPYSLQDLLDKRMPNEASSKYEMHWSFYISRHLGHHLLRYLKLLKGTYYGKNQ